MENNNEDDILSSLLDNNSDNNFIERSTEFNEPTEDYIEYEVSELRNNMDEVKTSVLKTSNTLLDTQKLLKEAEGKLTDLNKDVFWIKRAFWSTITIFLVVVLVWFVDTFFIYQGVKEEYLQSVKNNEISKIILETKMSNLEKNNLKLKEDFEDFKKVFIESKKSILKDIELMILKNNNKIQINN